MFGLLKTLFNLESGEGKKRRLEKLIATDPKLKEIGDRITNLNREAAKDLKEDEDFMEVMKELGIHIE